MVCVVLPFPPLADSQLRGCHSALGNRGSSIGTRPDLQPARKVLAHGARLGSYDATPRRHQLGPLAHCLGPIGGAVEGQACLRGKNEPSRSPAGSRRRREGLTAKARAEQ